MAFEIPSELESEEDISIPALTWDELKEKLVEMQRIFPNITGVDAGSVIFSWLASCQEAKRSEIGARGINSLKSMITEARESTGRSAWPL